MRVPRTLIGILAGAALGLSGAILQGVTRNPLADPGIMGINAGAAAFIVFGIMVLGVQGIGGYVWLAFLGAGVATVTVYGIASFGREGATPVKLALAGAAVTAILSSLTSAIVMTNVDALNELRFWQVGSLAGRYMPVFWQTAPFIVLGLFVAMLTGRALNGLALGEDLALALGQRVRLTRFVHVRDRRGAVRRGHRGVRADRVRRSRRAAPRAVHLRPRLPLDPAVLPGADADRAARRRHHRPRRGLARRAAGRRRARRPRRAGVHRARPLPNLAEL